MSAAARVTAHGKINLGLRVLARERSGYHSIETVFARIALADRVTVRVGGGAQVVECGGPRMPGGGLGPPERNLALRAALAYRQAAGWPDGFRIEVEKHIPVGGGLGGGSADAGATFRALNALAPRPLAASELLRLAGTVGADVPFLTSTIPMALAWGRGERLLALPPLPERSVALVIPSFAVATADAYAWLSESRTDDTPVPAVRSLGDLTSWSAVAPWSANDLEPVVTWRYPRIREIMHLLRDAGARIARMSGSGSVVFGIFDAPPDHASLAAALREEVVVTDTVAHLAPVETVESDGARL